MVAPSARAVNETVLAQPSGSRAISRGSRLHREPVLPPFSVKFCGPLPIEVHRESPCDRFSGSQVGRPPEAFTRSMIWACGSISTRFACALMNWPMCRGAVRWATGWYVRVWYASPNRGRPALRRLRCAIVGSAMPHDSLTTHCRRPRRPQRWGEPARPRRARCVTRLESEAATTGARSAGDSLEIRRAAVPREMRQSTSVGATLAPARH